MKVLDGSLPFEEHTTKQTKNTRKCPKQMETQQLLQFSDQHNNIKTFVQNIKESLKFLKTLRTIPKISPKIQHNAPRREIGAVKYFLAILTGIVIQITYVQNFIR